MQENDDLKKANGQNKLPIEEMAKLLENKMPENDDLKKADAKNKLTIQEMAKLLENKTQENDDLKNAEAQNKLKIQEMVKILEKKTQENDDMKNAKPQQFNEMTQKLQESQIKQQEKEIESQKIEIDNLKKRYVEAEKILKQKDKEYDDLDKKNNENLQRFKHSVLANGCLVTSLQDKIETLQGKINDLEKENNPFSSQKKCPKNGKALKIVQKITDFNIREKPINSGSYGTLYRATLKTDTSHKYAIKTMSIQNKNEEEIKKEINIWTMLQNCDKPRSFPEFYQYFQKETTNLVKTIEYHLVFDYYPFSLRSVINSLKENKEDRPFPLEKLIYFSQCLINALAYLQTLKVCHRDIKPENLLLDETWDQIYIIDFGESKELDNYATVKTKLVGTPKYLSPELYKILIEQEQGATTQENFGTINVLKSDVFALGLVLLELGILELPKRNIDVDVYAKNISLGIKKFRNIYDKIAEELNLKKELDNLVGLMNLCLQIEYQRRTDFIGLFLKIEEMRGENYEVQIQELILRREEELNKEQKKKEELNEKGKKKKVSQSKGNPEKNSKK